MDLQVDTYLSNKARVAWPAAIVREERDGRWWLLRYPASTPYLLSEAIGTPEHPRRAFLAARVRLGILVKAALRKQGAS